MRIRSLSTVSVAGAVLLLASCGGGSPTGPSAPSEAYTDMPGSASIVKASGKLAVCTPLPAATRTATVGRLGGTITVGPHRLWIPPGALLRSTTITATIVAGDSTNSVQFSPEGLQFAAPGLMSMSYDNCGKKSSLAIPQVVFTSNDLLQILELLPSVDNPVRHTVTGIIRHFSRYAIAY